jgi:hypothetical protein
MRSQPDQRDTRRQSVRVEITLQTIAGVFLSETTLILFATAIGIWSHYRKDPEKPEIWLCGLLLVSLFLKLLAVLATVRREELVLPDHKTDIEKGDEDDKLTRTEIFEVDMPTLGFPLITFQAPICDEAFQFFRHYGYPIRSKISDRLREIICILDVYAYVLVFPAGLIALAWMNSITQYLWLAYQVYTILAMHIIRLCGWEGARRTEERVAKVLQVGKPAYLVGRNGALRATLQIESVPGIAEGRARVKGRA